MQGKQVKFRITPKNKKLLKSSKVRKFFKDMEKVIAYHLEEQGAFSKAMEAVYLGVPLMMHEDGRIEVVKKYTKEKYGRSPLLDALPDFKIANLFNLRKFKKCKTRKP